MNRNRYRLIFSPALGMMVPVAESARSRGKTGPCKAASGSALALAGVLLAGPVQAELPVASVNFVAPGTTANYQTIGTQAYMSQVGNKAVVNFQSFNVSAGHDVQFRQVENLSTQNLVQGANFASLVRIHDINPSIIAGSISQAAGQQANVTMVNSNGIAFMGGSQVNLNSFTASTLDMKDSFLDNFLPGNSAAPQFEGAIDGGAARGFIKVFEGAQITAGQRGRVMLIAPTVVNKGTVKAPDGQIITAAASKVYLRSAGGEIAGLLVEVDSPEGLSTYDAVNPDIKAGELDGQAVALADPEHDKLGNVTNLGELTTPRGNVTMIGFAVNQNGIARATTSVVSGGSVYLLAKDTAKDVSTQTPSALRAGRVTLGQNSLTEILPEVDDRTTTQDGTGGIALDRPSAVKILGQDIRMAGSSYDLDGKEIEDAKGARIVAPAGMVSLIALDNPSKETSSSTSIFGGATPVSSKARVHIARGAIIDVAGLNDVEVEADRSTVQIDLRGNELKDSPINRLGALTGEKVFIDVDSALENSDSGKTTLVARDVLLDLKAQQQRNVAERSTQGGAVEVYSQGEAIIESGAVIDLSGGSLKFTPGSVKTTLLTSNGKLTDVADANAETRYDGIATRYVKKYPKWNREEIIDLGQSFRYDAGYGEGKDAGSLAVFGIGGVYADPAIAGRTLTGERQREAGIQPAGARFTVGYDDTPGPDDKNAVAIGGVTVQDYKLNQAVELTANRAALSGFKLGDVLPAVLQLDSALLSKDKVAQLTVYSNQAVTVRDALRGPQGGAVTLAGSRMTVNADIDVASGVIDLSAVNTIGQLPDALPAPKLTIVDGVSLTTRGTWSSDLPESGARTADAPRIDGGTIKLAAKSLADGANNFIAQGELTLGQGVTLDADGGGWLKANGKVKAGDGGEVALSGYAVRGLERANVHAYGLGKGGKLKLGSNRIQIGGTVDATPGTLNLNTDWFERGGFADYALTALTRLEVAKDTEIKPVLISRELGPDFILRASGSRVADFGDLVVRDAQARQGVDLLLAAADSKAETGKVLIGQGARIELDPKAQASLNAFDLIDIEGTIRAPGGTILARTSNASSTIWLGRDAVLDTAGVAQTYVDHRGLTQGEVLAGGTVDLAAPAIVSEAGSRVDVSGAAPVRLDLPNENGGLGRTIGSDAGAVKLFAGFSALLDGNFAAHAGGSTQRGGDFDMVLGQFVDPGPNIALTPLTLSLAQSVVPQADDLQPGDVVTGRDTRIAADRLETAGFDRLRFASKDAIQLEDGLALGAGRSLPLRELALDAASIRTVGGNAALSAETVRLGNYDPIRRAASSASTDTGVLAVNARQLELAGKLKLEGMARAELNAVEAIRLAGVTTGTTRPTGELQTTADLVFHGAVVAPTTYTQYRILAPQHSVSFSRTTDTPTQPLSALGSLTVEARYIVQDGNLWAPFGQMDFKASESLVFKNGSLTSVAATPGSITPFGKVQNGRTWLVDLDAAKVPDGQLEQSVLAEKSIRTAAKTIDMQAGAKLDLAGGGDLQAYEFTVGPGGSRDILADKNTYAILPAYTGGIAPGDAQEERSFDRKLGEAVYLSGVPGLKDGVYTLLPAHYALLPGAYAVKLDTGVKDLLPGQAYSRQDGVRIAAGYITDTRVNAPQDARWSGIEVLTHDQVRARSEFTLTRASDFFAESRNRPQDGGLLSIATTGSGSDSLKLDAIYKLAAGTGGRGAAVDVSALKLAIVNGNPSGIDPAATQLDVDKLNALGADSLLLGGTRSTSGDTTTLTVGADTVTLANDASHALEAGEILLVAADTLTLKSGSVINAQGEEGAAGHYETAGGGALVRAAATTATFARTGNPDRTQGTLVGEVGSKIIAADSITLDATKENAYKGTAIYNKNGVMVVGNLAVGASRVNLGAAPVTAEGISYSQAELNELELKELTLTSYSTFDLYGDVQVGQLDANGKPVLQNLTLQGAGLAGIDNVGQTARINAKNFTLTNPNNAATFTAGGALGSGNLAVTTDTLRLGEGSKKIQGYGGVTVTASELIGAGTGTLDVNAPVTLNLGRISGERGANQELNASGALVVANRLADHALAPVTALGAKWALAGTRVDFNSHAELPSGSFKLSARGGDVKLGAEAKVDVAGRSVQFFDVSKPSWGGTAEFVSDAGNVEFVAGSNVDVSAAAGGDAGTLIVRAQNGEVSIADRTVKGGAAADADGRRGEGARVALDTGTLASFSALNTALNSGGFDGERDLRVRTGDVSIAAGDTVKALDIKIAADGGKLDVMGVLDASGDDAGRIELFAKNDVNVLDTARLKAESTGMLEDGGDIEIGTRDGNLNLAAGSTVDLSGGAGGRGGTLLLRAQRTANDVNIGALDSRITGARSVAVEALKVYGNNINTINTLTATGGSGTTLSLATINADNTAYAVNHAAIKARLGKTADAGFHILSGVEVRAAGDLTLSNDWNLATSRAGGEAGMLTLRAAGNLKINNNLSDGFSHATPCTTAACSATTPSPATLQAGESWSYRLIAGADEAAANPLAVKAGGHDVTLAAGKLIRTGTGDVRIASGRDIVLADKQSAIYTAGRAADALTGFVTPNAVLKPVFSQDGGDVSLAALGDISGKPSAQLYSQWLYRQGAINPATGDYTQQPAWWVRFDQFQQGVGALGGGDVTLAAGGKIKDVSASAPTQGRTVGTAPVDSQLVITGGGDMKIKSGSDILGGSYYVGRGDLALQSGGRIGVSDQKIDSNTDPISTILALGDAQARVRASTDATISNVLTPHLLNPSAGNLKTQFPFLTTPIISFYSTYGADSGVDLQSLSGKVGLTHDSLLVTKSQFINQSPSQPNAWQFLPPSLQATSYQGAIEIGGGFADLILAPGAQSDLTLLAADSITLKHSLSLSDIDAGLIPNAVRPANIASNLASAKMALDILIRDPVSPNSLRPSTPTHLGDPKPVRIYAVAGDVKGVNTSSNTTSTILDVSKRAVLKAGRDVSDFAVYIQHTDTADVSSVEAGRDIVFSSTNDRREHEQIRIGGPGRLEVTAGRNIDLGTSGGIVSRGNADNPNLPRAGADLHLAAGVGAKGVDYLGAVDRLVAMLEATAPDDAALWQARWLTGDDTLAIADALAAVKVVDAQDADTQRERVRALLFSALRTTGRDSNNAASPYAGDFARGYAALETIFPGISEKTETGDFKNYAGEINLFASRVKTERGGDIEFFAPGGDVIVGLPNTPAALVNVGSNVLGMVAVEKGDIKGASRGDIRVNQSRILTVGGGDVLLWSSEGDIDAGKGKKTASAVPPPVISIDGEGNVTVELQGAVTGSGIGALESPGVIAGNVDLIAPKGIVNAGDAGIRAGNLNIAAQVVLGADNISVSGSSSGTPVADTSAVSAASSGASNAGGEVSNATAALSQNLADAARSAEELKQAFKPTFITAEVIGHGE